MKIENQMNYDTYKICNFVKPPNSVGIVPESPLLPRDPPPDDTDGDEKPLVAIK